MAKKSPAKKKSEASKAPKKSNNPADKAKAATEAASKSKKPRQVPATNAHLTKQVSDNCPPNWKGTKDQYVALYRGCAVGFREEAERAFAKLFPRMVMDAMNAEASLGKPRADMELSITVDFTKYDTVNLSGSASHTRKEKITVALGHVEELKQMDFLKDAGQPGASPNMKDNTAVPVGGDKNAPSNKAADTTTTKAKAGTVEKFPTPPAVTEPAAAPADAKKE